MIEAKTFAVHFEDMDMMGETVEQRPGQALRAERLGPFVEGEIRGDEASASRCIAAGRPRFGIGAVLSPTVNSRPVADEAHGGCGPMKNPAAPHPIVRR